jgi:hypothetical protein
VKNLLITIMATLVCVAAFAQGKLEFDINSDNLIYITTDITSLPPGDATKTADNGFGAGPFPLPGSSLYAGPNSTAAALGGTWVVSLFGGTSPSSLSLQATASLADVSSGNVGGINAVNVTFASFAAGTPVWFQVDVSNGGLCVGKSMIFEATPQASVYSPIYQTQSPVNSTWTPGTFVPTDLVQLGGGYYGGIVVPVPEPGTFALVGLGAAVLMIYRRRR